jgi:hypothetical protein
MLLRSVAISANGVEADAGAAALLAKRGAAAGAYAKILSLYTRYATCPTSPSTTLVGATSPIASAGASLTASAGLCADVLLRAVATPAGLA